MDGYGSINDNALYVMRAVAREFCPGLHTYIHNEDQPVRRVFPSIGMLLCEEAAVLEIETQRHSWYFETSNRHTNLFGKD